MNLRVKTISELLDIALYTTSLSEMLFLEKHPSMNVRRALAKNKQIDENVLANLLFDPVQNVSYIAGLHPKNKNIREIDSNRPCVICEKDEKYIDCIDCILVQEHSF